MNITEKAIMNLIKYYSLSNAAQLANKFEITQGVVSNWKSRNAIGALTDTVANKDPEALVHIFSSDKNTQNISGDQNANNVQANQIQREKINKNEYIIPETTMDDLNTLFKIAIENRKENNLIEKIDDFIHATKKELRKI